MSVLRYTPGVYSYNPACQCVACVNGGDIPFPGAAETLGYAMPHIPPNTRAPWAPGVGSD